MDKPAVNHATEPIDSPDALRALVSEAVRGRTSLADFGLFHAGLGNPPPADAMHFRQSSKDVEHYIRDLTVRTAAGVTLGQLQEVLRQQNQFLPVDADEKMTIGEIVQHHVYGALRCGYGSVRDQLLGLRYIDGQSQDIHVGGRTVKNVAGYDMTRFLVGSLGELAAVYEYTIRTAALPQAAACVQWQVADPAMFTRSLTDLMLTDAAPQWLGMTRAKHSFIGIAGYHGQEKSCQVQIEAAQAFAQQSEAIADCETVLHDFPQDAKQRRQLSDWQTSASSVVKILVPPADTGALCTQLANQCSQLQIEAYPMHGCIYAGGQLDMRQALELDQLIIEWVNARPGYRMWIRRPDNAHLIEPIAPLAPEYDLLCRLKRTMDPHAVFNTGRFLKS